MRRHFSMTPLLAALVVLGCVGAGRVLVEESPLVRPYDAKGGRVVREFRAQYENVFECDSRGCLKRGWDQCSPAHLFEAHYTAEGTVAFADTFVVPWKGRCAAVVYTDFTRDFFGGCTIVRSVCPDVDSTTSDGPNGCTREVLYKAPACKDPFKNTEGK